MKAKSYRIFYTVAAIVLGIGIVLMLSFAGDKSHGPIEHLLSKASSAIINMENYFILQQRDVRRKDKIKWFQSYKSNMGLLKKPKIILLGAYDNQTTESFESVINLEDSLQTTFSLIHIYTAWGSKPEEQFPKTFVEAILELGALPVITWEPWLTDFDADKYPDLRKSEYRDKGGLADIAKGVYDFYIKQWAADAKEIKQPIFLRFGHEMNDPYRYPWGPHNNSAQDFINAWKHVYKIFRDTGTKNVIWIWSPHPAYGYFEAFYPGNEYVDYVGAGTLNYGTVASWSQWWTFDEILGAHYNELAAFNKPMMITEFGSLACGGNRSKWFEDALSNLPQNFPAIKGILFFHVSDDKTTTQQALNWYIKNDRPTLKAIIHQVKLWPDSVKPKNCDTAHFSPKLDHRSVSRIGL